VKRHILLVDDEIDIRTVVQATLELVGNMKVSLASSGAEGLQKAETEQPDAILLDVMLPDMDGVTTLKQLQENPKTCHIPVIFLTAKARATNQGRFADLGATATITKPFDPVTLSDQIVEVLGWIN
jgi:CheY-like chemotaxis protein